MKTWISKVVVAIAFTLMAPVLAHADTWKIDPMHTSVEFTVRHMMISNVKGTFEKTSGTITVEGSDPTTAKIDAVIDASSINTRVERRDADLKSPDFLDVAKYPTITFKSTKVEAAGKGKWKVTGDLTLHGVTKPVVLDVDRNRYFVADHHAAALERFVISEAEVFAVDFRCRGSARASVAHWIVNRIASAFHVEHDRLGNSMQR